MYAQIATPLALIIVLTDSLALHCHRFRCCQQYCFAARAAYECQPQLRTSKKSHRLSHYDREPLVSSADRPCACSAISLTYRRNPLPWRPVVLLPLRLQRLLLRCSRWLFRHSQRQQLRFVCRRVLAAGIEWKNKHILNVSFMLDFETSLCLLCCCLICASRRNTSIIFTITVFVKNKRDHILIKMILNNTIKTEHKKHSKQNHIPKKSIKRKQETLIKSNCSMLCRRTRISRDWLSRVRLLAWGALELFCDWFVTSLLSTATDSLFSDGRSGMPSTLRRSDTFILAVASPIESPSYFCTAHRALYRKSGR